jgi:hypothetical protein
VEDNSRFLGVSLQEQDDRSLLAAEPAVEDDGRVDHREGGDELGFSHDNLVGKGTPWVAEERNNPGRP